MRVKITSQKLSSKLITRGCCASIAFLLSATSAQAVELQEAVNQTLSTHPAILSAQAQESAAREDVRVAKGAWLPSLDVAGGIGKERSDNPATRAGSGGHYKTLTSRESNIAVQQLLFDGGNVSNTIKARKADLQTNKYQVSETQEALAFAAAKAFLDVRRERVLVSIARDDVEIHRETLAKVKKRLEGGAGRKSELELAKSRLSLAKSRLTRAQGLLDDANDTYKKVVGTDAPQRLPLPTLPYTASSLQEAQATAMQSNPSIGATDAQLDARQADVGISKSAFYPTFTIDLTANFDQDTGGVKGHKNDQQAMLNMTYNLFNGGSDWAAVHGAQDRVTAAQHDTQNIRRDVNEDVAISWNNLQTAKNRLPDLKAHRDQSKQVFIAYGKQFQLGQRTLFDLLNANTEYFDAKAAYIVGLYDVRIGTYRLLASMGRLVELLGNSNTNVVASADMSDDSNTATKVADNSDNTNDALQVADNAQDTQPVDNPGDVQLAQADIDADAATKVAAETAETANEIHVADNGASLAADAAQGAETAAVAGTGVLAANETGNGPDALEDHYTIQLMAAKTPNSMNQFIRDHHLERDTTYVKTAVEGHDWYLLLKGDFASKDAAQVAMNNLPEDIQEMHPVIRPVASLTA